MDKENDTEKANRNFEQTPCCQIDFDVLNIHGLIDPSKDTLPTSLTVYLVPSSFQRFMRARQAVDSGVGIAGCYLRNNDFRTNLAGHAPLWKKLLISQGTSGHYSVEAECFCRESNCFIQADKEIEATWFDEVLGQLLSNSHSRS